jgi:hyperosmotically inducible periplasmic protein
MKNLNKSILATLIAASMAVALPVSAGDAKDDHRTVGETVDDATITASIKTSLLADDRTEGFDINVDTKNGHVTLTGGADSLADKMAAADIAKGATGVLSVNNQITIAADGSEVRQEANTATASGEVRETLEESGDDIDDAWITSKVKTQLLADGTTPGLDINVETKDNVVHLIGHVPTAAARAEAIRIAQTTKGVEKVIADQLLVRAG